MEGNRSWSLLMGIPPLVLSPSTQFCRALWQSEHRIGHQISDLSIAMTIDTLKASFHLCLPWRCYLLSQWPASVLQFLLSSCLHFQSCITEMWHQDDFSHKICSLCFCAKELDLHWTYSFSRRHFLPPKISSSGIFVSATSLLNFNQRNVIKLM